jgi:hypothetical protein
MQAAVLVMVAALAAVIFTAFFFYYSSSRMCLQTMSDQSFQVLVFTSAFITIHYTRLLATTAQPLVRVRRR